VEAACSCRSASTTNIRDVEYLGLGQADLRRYGAVGQAA
jgi:hypothetical protein